MAQKHAPLQQGPMQIHHGHTDTHVLIKFSRPADHIMFTPPELDNLIKAMLESKEMLAAHQAKKVAES